MVLLVCSANYRFSYWNEGCVLARCRFSDDVAVLAELVGGGRVAGLPWRVCHASE